MTTLAAFSHTGPVFIPTREITCRNPGPASDVVTRFLWVLHMAAGDPENMNAAEVMSDRRAIEDVPLSEGERALMRHLVRMAIQEWYEGR